MQSQIEDLNNEKMELQNKLDSMTSEFSTLKTESAKYSEAHQSVNKLSFENKELSAQVECLKYEMDKVIAEKDEVENEKLELSKTEIKLSHEIQELKSELYTIKTAKEDFSEHKNQLLETQTMLDSKTLEFDQSFNNCEKLNKENKELLNRLEVMENELDNTKKESQGVAKQEVSNTLQCFENILKIIMLSQGQDRQGRLYF